jgi:hypothetical protein
MSHRQQTGLAHRLAHELKEYAAVSVYLYVCLGALLLYKGAVLQAEGIGYAPYGLAAVKALILGKFMLVGHALRIGHRKVGKPLIYPILHKSFAFLALLLVLDVIEEVIVGLVHGRSIVGALAEIGGGTWRQMLATCLLFLLILLPYFAYREVGEFLGEGTMRRILFSGSAPQT